MNFMEFRAQNSNTIMTLFYAPKKIMNQYILQAKTSLQKHTVFIERKWL